jgi:hypothetical protein
MDPYEKDIEWVESYVRHKLMEKEKVEAQESSSIKNASRQEPHPQI